MEYDTIMAAINHRAGANIIEGDFDPFGGQSLAHRVPDASSDYPTNSFGFGGNKAAYSSEKVRKAHGRANREAEVFLWQLQNIIFTQIRVRAVIEDLEFVVNVGTPNASGKIYLVQMKKPFRAVLRLCHTTAGNKWSYTIDKSETNLPQPGV